MDPGRSGVHGDDTAVPHRQSGSLSLGDNHPMDERELAAWLNALVDQGLIGEWHWTRPVEPGQPAAVSYVIDRRRYTHAGAIRLVRDFEVGVR